MSITDYLLNGVLVALVFLQIRGRRLTPRSFVLPLVIVGFVAVEYLHGIPTAGNDLTLAILGAVVGATLGTACGLATRVTRRADGQPFAKAGLLAAGLWVLGVGARLAFELYATNGGQAAIGRFSASHAINSGEAWVACLVLMAIAEVLTRSAVLAIRSYRLVSQDTVQLVPTGAGATMMEGREHWA